MTNIEKQIEQEERMKTNRDIVRTIQVKTIREKPAYQLSSLGEVVGVTGMQEVDEQIYAVH